MITTNFWGVQIFRKFTVFLHRDSTTLHKQLKISRCANSKIFVFHKLTLMQKNCHCDSFFFFYFRIYPFPGSRENNSFAKIYNIVRLIVISKHDIVPRWNLSGLTIKLKTNNLYNNSCQILQNCYSNWLQRPECFNYEIVIKIVVFAAKNHENPDGCLWAMQSKCKDIIENNMTSCC